MAATSYRLAAWRGEASPRRRGGALILTALVHVLLLLMLLRLAPFIPASAPSQPGTKTFDVAAEGETAATRSKAESRARESAGGRARAPDPAPQAAEREAPTPPGPITLPPNIIMITRRDFAGGDVARLPREADAATATAARGEAGDGDAAGEQSAAGGGGGGERLYDVDWYRKPTNAELSTYLPRKSGLTGWGMIACKTAPNYRVEDCRELGQSPAGSGLARAVREAAWQFRVLPPRIGSTPQIGAWVRIRIDYTEGVPK